MTTWARRILAALLSTGLAAGAAQADVALVISGSEADRREFLRGGARDSRRALRSAGFDVISADVGSVEAMRAGLSRLLGRIAEEDRVVIHLSGQFARGGGRAWLLQGDIARAPDLATIDSVGLSLDTVLEVAALLPGQAVVVMGRSGGDTELGPGLRSGIGGIDVPQGVTLISGPSAEVSRLVQDRVTQAGVTLAEMADGASGVTLRGFAGPIAFIPEGQARPIAPPDADEAERAIWQAARAQDTLPAYRGYLARYPNGLFAEEARAAIAAIEAEPFRAARLTEEALGLDRNARRVIQRELTLLGYQPRGVDGIFGNGTRSAIRRFQSRNGFPETGYVDQVQISRLSLQAEARRAQIEADERRERLEQERQDHAAWQATGAGSDEAGIRTYLARFPEGIYAEEARARLDEITRAADRAAWNEAERVGTAAAYEGYLNRYPEGAFAQQARARLERLRPPDPQERDVELPRVTLLLVERRLAQLGLEPGVADGVLDRATRRALRAFQRNNGLRPSGALTQPTLSALLQGAAAEGEGRLRDLLSR